MIFHVYQDGEVTTFRTADGFVLVAELSETDRDNIRARKQWPALYACAAAEVEEAEVRQVLDMVKGAGS